MTADRAPRTSGEPPAGDVESLTDVVQEELGWDWNAVPPEHVPSGRSICRDLAVRFLAALPGLGWVKTDLVRPGQQRDQQVTDVAWISLADLVRDYLPGSHPQPWTWSDEAAELDAAVCGCCQRPGHYQRNLEAQLRQQGKVEQGVALGGDGRIWDGHHRIVAAMRLGLDGVPVENDLPTPARSDAAQEPQTVAWGLWDPPDATGPDDLTTFPEHAAEWRLLYGEAAVRALVTRPDETRDET